MFELLRSMFAFVKTVSSGALVLLASVLVLACGGKVESDSAETSAAVCEWLEWDLIDPTAPEAVRPRGVSPDRDVCYLLWVQGDSGRIALAAQGESASTVSCAERTESKPLPSDPLLVRPGQVAWSFRLEHASSGSPGLQAWACAELDLALDYGAKLEDLTDGHWDSRAGH